MLVVLVEVLGSQFQAVGAAGHRGGVVGVDRVHAVVAAQGIVARGVVDYGIVLVRRVVRFLVHQGENCETLAGWDGVLKAQSSLRKSE